MKAIMRDKAELRDSGIEWIGDIPSNWSNENIKYHFDVIAGATPDSKNPEYWDGDITWVTPADYKTEDKYVKNGKRSLSLGGYQSCSASLVPEGSIIFSKRAPIGTVALSATELCTNQGCLACVPQNNVDSTYYYYVMSIATEEFELKGSGTTFKEISASNFVNTKLPYPMYEEQQSIANYLDDRCSKIDTIIAEAKASIEEYKELKQAVIYAALTKGLNKNVPMKNSGIKWIGKTPINWEVTQLKRYIDILPGYAFSSEDFAKDGIPLLRGINVTPNGTRWDDVVYWNQSIDDNLLPYMLKAGDIVVGLDRPWISDGTRAIIVKEADLPCLLLQRVCRIRVSSNVDYRFVYYWLIGKSFENALTSDTTGISVPHISTNQIGNFIISFPSLSEQILICDYVDKKVRGISSLISEKQSLIEDLESYKKSLIYEVVTGKRKVVE